MCRWLSIFHLLPRLLLLSSLHKRINTPYTSKIRRTAGGRRIRAPCDLARDAFKTRVRAFLNGRFYELLSTSYDVTNYPHLPQNQTHYSPESRLSPIAPTRSLRSRALEVRDLVRLDELSRAVTRADAALLATPSPSTISALTQLHPQPAHSTDTSAVRTDIVSPPLRPPANPLCDSLIILILLKNSPTRPLQTTVGGATNTLCGHQPPYNRCWEKPAPRCS